MDRKDVSRELQDLPTTICNELISRINASLNKAGLYYRSFSRIKSTDSAFEKITKKKYDDGHKKMQDLFGVRIALYFRDDVEICCDIIKQNFDVVDISKDVETPESFKPTRLNYVCRLPEEVTSLLSGALWNLPIDKTFEIQFRTVFSEGWHEVDHDLRYKSESAWINHPDLSRNLNGILATLETCDWAIGNVFHELAHRKYKEQDWESMLQNQLRIHIIRSTLSSKIATLLTEDSNLAKELFRIDRKKLLLCLSNTKLGGFPKTFDNLIFIINQLYMKNPQIVAITPEQIQKLALL